MPQALHIPARHERLLVRAADVALAPLRWWRPVRPPHRVERVLLLRLERIGDLLMTLDAIRDARAAWPEAEIDLAVGRWNEPLAALIPEVTSIIVADAPWLVRGTSGASWRRLLTTARTWRARRYDLVINIEPDIRSNLLAWMTGAPIRVGYGSAGGGAFLTDASPYDPTRHTSINARQIVARAAGTAPQLDAPDAPRPRLSLPDAARARAQELLGDAHEPLVGIHASGGRLSKQWHLDRFAEVGRTLARDRGATIVLTGSPADAAQVDEVARLLGPARVLRVDGTLDLPTLAAVLGSLDLFVSSDTGPMHLAAAMGTPVVALFGPADPRRYGPRSPVEQIIRIDLPCSPCGQVRLPPPRCRGHIPDCMDGITAQSVIDRALLVLDRPGRVDRPESA